MEHGISYLKLQMMMVDMPRVVRGEKKEHYELTDDNASEFFGALMNSGKRIKNQ